MGEGYGPANRSHAHHLRELPRQPGISAQLLHRKTPQARQWCQALPSEDETLRARCGLREILRVLGSGGGE